ncbi:MAG: C45 family autoproteolytic acyltransferase/hydrolase [Dehalococcoidia bacterium]|jgi:isopenicillin-N N-acyltransferase-like protein|nr:peptidase C45 [Chloroflexota bacterium]MDP6056173.1 C45 family autoproteolytic acyltransferase/hydrolase [Dehalococcoidia bacterium]|tara:strand:- start:1756 stop:2841 length:1086 start_codon:yes stop_codon:yes gene_type:complete
MSFPSSIRFPELTVAGSPSKMGRQIGEHFRHQIGELSELVLDRFNKGSETKITWDHAKSAARQSFERVAEFFPGPLDELHGTAEAAGVPVERLMVLNVRNALSGASEGCTSIMVSAESSATGKGFAGQNWDNDSAMAPLSAVITRKGSGKPTFTSWTQPGLVAYMGFSSAGFGICMNALNGPSTTSGLPWYFFVRAIFESNSPAEAISAVKTAPRALTGNAAMITNDGPLDLEITPGSVEAIKSDSDGLLVHTNHCVHPSLVSNNDEFPERIYGQSFERRDRGQDLLRGQQNGSGVSLDDAKKLLSDHDGFPTSICRHPNEHPNTGWQRSVVSIILEPSENQMHVSNGNPCENSYEIYKAD